MVSYSYANFRSAQVKSPTCALDERIKRSMDEVQRSAERPIDEYTNYMTMYAISNCVFNF